MYENMQAPVGGNSSFEISLMDTAQPENGSEKLAHRRQRRYRNLNLNKSYICVCI